MELPVYVTVEEVQRVCQALKIRDWTQLADAKVTPEEARVILQEVNARACPSPWWISSSAWRWNWSTAPASGCQRHQQSSDLDG